MVKGDSEEFQAAVRKALEELGTSHTAFYSECPTRNATLSEINLNGAPRWMFVDVFEDGPAHKAGVRPGDVLLAVDGVEPEASNLPAFGIARTHSLIVARENQTDDIKVEVPFRKGSKNRPPLVEPTSISQRMIAPGIGLLKVLYFPGSIGIRFGKMVASSMGILHEQGARSLVIDLRGNIGGSLGFASLVQLSVPWANSHRIQSDAVPPSKRVQCRGPATCADAQSRRDALMALSVSVWSRPCGRSDDDE